MGFTPIISNELEFVLTAINIITHPPRSFSRGQHLGKNKFSEYKMEKKLDCAYVSSLFKTTVPVSSSCSWTTTSPKPESMSSARSEWVGFIRKCGSNFLGTKHKFWGIRPLLLWLLGQDSPWRGPGRFFASPGLWEWRVLFLVFDTLKKTVLSCNGYYTC